MGIDEAGQEHPAAQVGDRLVRMIGSDPPVRAAGDDHPVAHEDATVLICGQGIERVADERVAGSVDHRRPIDRHRGTAGPVSDD